MPDVVVAGGGIIGCAAAAYLLDGDPTLDVVVVEPDPTYALAATPRASGGVRQLFSRPENIALSRYTLEVIADWLDLAATDEPAPDLGWTPGGYLFVAAPDGASALRENLVTQRASGVECAWLEPAEIAERYPAVRADDLGGGVLSPRDGWLDPHSFLRGFRRLAAFRGADFRRDRVTGCEVRDRRVVGVRLESGDVLDAGDVVNAAGCWASDLAAGVGMPLPVEPMRRFEHFVAGPSDLAGYPFLKDPDGLAIRPEGDGLSVGLVDFDRPGGDADPGDGRYFDDHVWPALAHRLPRFDRARLRSTTTGHYDQNRLDGNAVIGNWPGHLDNFHVACGFSGHGMMHAPGVGRALSELILHGGYRTLDLSALGYQRVADERPYAERGIR